MTFKIHQFLHAQSVWFRGHSYFSHIFFTQLWRYSDGRAFAPSWGRSYLVYISRFSSVQISSLQECWLCKTWSLALRGTSCRPQWRWENLRKERLPKQPYPVMANRESLRFSSVQTDFWKDAWSWLEVFSNQRATFFYHNIKVSFLSAPTYWIIRSWKPISFGLSHMKVGLWSRTKHGELWPKRNVFIKARNNRSKGVKLTTNTALSKATAWVC